MIQRFVTVSAVVALSGLALGGPYDPPPSEYTNVDTAVANSTPATLAANLRSALDTLTSVATHVSYQNGRFRYDESDLDLDTPGNIIVIYSGASISSVWDSGATWNREHTWPASHLSSSSSSGLEYTDFHQLRPCYSSVNSSRGNKPFGQTGSNSGSSLWDPGFDPRGGALYTFDPQDRGEMARAMFYAAVRHDNELINATNESQLNNGQMGHLDTLIRWHFEHVTDERERFRNDVIDDTIQFNRNPFVDRNEYVWAIWGDEANDSQITLDGETPANGATASAIDLGDVIAGSAFGTTTAGFTKTGDTPTTYRIYTSGDAINDLTDVTITPARSGSTFRMTTTTDEWRGRTLAFPYGPASLAGTITGISLLPQDTPGVRVGTVVIDNTDLTSAGSGLGNDDGDDVITVMGREVDHSNASFADDSDVNSSSVDFGVVSAGDMPTDVVRITNLEATPGLTAELRVTGVMGTGDTGAFDLGNIPTLMNLNGGNTSVNTVTLIETTPGMYSATYTIDVADNPIPGATANASLTLTLMATVEETLMLCSADFDGDGDVDLGDFGVFGAQFGATNCAP